MIIPEGFKPFLFVYKKPDCSDEYRYVLRNTITRKGKTICVGPPRSLPQYVTMRIFGQSEALDMVRNLISTQNR